MNVLLAKLDLHAGGVFTRLHRLPWTGEISMERRRVFNLVQLCLQSVDRIETCHSAKSHDRKSGYDIEILNLLQEL